MPSSPARTNRFQSFTPLRSTTGSLHRLKTAFSPIRSSSGGGGARSASPSSSISTSTTSPLTRNSSPLSYRSSSSSSAASIQHMLALRRQPSVLEFELQQERHFFGAELAVLEPRPVLGRGADLGGGAVVVVGIFEVLSGKC